ncbi:MAG TPA: Hsp20/alpha crystallin family protein [Nannocystis sp.]
MRCHKFRYRNTTIVASGPPGAHDVVRRLYFTELCEATICWRPEADIYETDTVFTLLVELAGVPDESIDILAFEDAVVIRGERRLQCEAGAVFHTAAIRPGPFRLAVRLPAIVDPERAAARYEHGLLRIVLPKTETR